MKKLAAAALIGVALFAGRAVMKTYFYRLSQAARKGQERLRKPASASPEDVRPT